MADATPSSNNTKGGVFHDGEIAVQRRAGVADAVARIGLHNIRGFMPDQHREFFAQLPYLIYGATDDSGRPWAAMLCGAPGFISTTNDTVLNVVASPLAGDPVYAQLQEGSNIGVLGIEMHTRRRNRVNGSISTVSKTGFTMVVRQSFGNCPKYIQMRETESNESRQEKPGSTPSEVTATDQAVTEANKLSVAQQQAIESADTFFISTLSKPDHPIRSRGHDVSHRGGKPGFVKVSDSNTLVWPDFAGNNFFNTLGNLTDTPLAGLLFPDFQTGNLLFLTGHAAVIWDSPDLDRFAGAQRLVQFTIEQTRQANAALPYRWSQAQLSPFLSSTGDWA